MAEILRITGKNAIQFDLAPPATYRLGRPPRGLSKVLTRGEVLGTLPRLPLGVRSHALKYGLSVIRLDFNILGVSDPDMEDREHDLLETLVEGALWIETGMARGIHAELLCQSAGASVTSYKTVLHGELDELDARDLLGAKIKAHRLEGLRLTLYCEPYWHKTAVTNLKDGFTVYNHDDAAHNNYVAIAGGNIEGDVPAKVYIRVRPLTHELMILRAFARYKGTVANFVDAYEAEIAGSSGRSNWADAALADASSGWIVTDAANVAGYVYWIVAANKPDQEGKFHLFGRVWTDDKDNTRFRARLTNAAGTVNMAVGKWKKVDESSVWKFLDLGPFEIKTPYGLTRDDWRWYVEYEKDAVDTAKLDWLFVAPVGEGLALLLPITLIPVPIADEFTWRGTHDFIEAYVYDPGGSEYIQPLNPQGWAPYPSLMPQKDTRVYFSVDTESPVGLYQNDVHEGTDERMIIYIDYLPQYISPLE